MLQLKCTGLVLSAMNAMNYAEGSINVPVQIEFDETYTDYKKTLHIGYYDSRGAEHNVSASQQDDSTFKIPGEAFAQAGYIFISVHFSLDGNDIEPETNAVQYHVSKTAGGVGSLPGGYVWEPVVKSYVQRIVDNGEITFNTDDTLSQSGQAADAKAVGDEISKLKEDIDDLKENGVSSGTVVSRIEPMEDDIPKVFFVGTAPTTKAQDELPLTMEYRSKTKTIKSYVTLKVQGDSSAKYPKKNFNLKMFNDADRTEKQKVTFRDWLTTHKYCLKANWIDHTHARNVVNGRLWNQVVRSRADYESYPVGYKESPHSGVVDGFPVKVYLNGVYQGIYTWNIRKDDSMFNMDDSTGTHAALISDAASNVTLWRGTPNIDGTDWTDELNDVVPDAVKTGFQAAASFIQTATDDEFKANIEQYFYLSSLIDFRIFIDCILMFGGTAKSQRMDTFDAVKYLANIYDMDTTWALKWNGADYYDYKTPFPSGFSAEAELGTSNLLYERLDKLFADEIKTRFSELRATVLSDANIINEFERFMDVIGKDLYMEDFAGTTAYGTFTGIPSATTNNLQKLREIIVTRMAYVDEKMNAIRCTGITLSESNLSFEGEGETVIIATVTPENCNQSIIWTSTDKTVATVIDGVVTAVSEGNATIMATCGDYSATCDVTVSGINTGVITDSLLFDLDLTQAAADNLMITDKTGNLSATVVAESIADNGVCVSKAYTNMVSCSWNESPTFNSEFAFEWFGFGFTQYGIFNGSYKGLNCHAADGSGLGVVPAIALTMPYINAAGQSAHTTGKNANTFILDDGTMVSPTSNDTMYNLSKYTHVVVNCHNDGAVDLYVNGYPVVDSIAVADFTNWDLSSFNSSFGMVRGNVNTDKILKTARMYNKCLTKEEIRMNGKYEASLIA